VCTNCLKDLKIQFTHDTKHGIATFNPVPIDMPDEYNLNLHMPADSIKKLLGTPEFTSIQGGIWLDHCNDFMEFIGIWEPKDFSNYSELSGKSLFMEMTEEDSNHLWSEWELSDNETDEIWIDVQYYAFKCTQCNKLKGYWDMG